MSAQYDYYPPQEYVLLANGAAELPAPKGPFKATVTLPSQLPPTLRCFTTDRTHSSKISAKRQVAFEACIALFREGLLNDHFLPHKFTRHGGEEHITALMKDIEKRSGLAPVVHQLDPWVVQPPNQNPEWHFILVSIGDKGMLKMFSKSTLLSELDQPAILSLFDTGEAQRVVFDYQHKLEEREFDHHLAIKFTRALFWATWSSNMDWESTDYPYLFLPLNLEVSDKLSKDQPGELLIPSQHLSFGETLPPFPWHAKGKNGARFFIRGSRTQALDDNEISVVMKFHNLREPPRSIEYVLEGSYFPKRSNFLLSPTQASQPLRKRDRQKLLLLPSHLSVDLVSGWLLQASMMLPSALEGLSHSLIAGSLQRKYFKTDLLCNVPRHLLLNAILASSVNAQQNYQRLETLGDSVLKLVASLSLLERHPQWHEGYLSRAKDHIVSNSSLAKASLSEGLAAFIIRRQFAGKKWAPSCLGGQANAKRKKITAEMLSSKILADVVESLIGACYMSVGLDGGVAFLRRILPQKDIAWHKPAECVQRINERTEAVLRVPRQIENVEKAIGWSFKRKRHILEALTHGSHQQATEQVLSYERMEFLGDAVLDFIVTSRTYLASEESFGPALLYKSKIALVNADLLGYLCFDIRVIGLRSTTRKVDNAYELEETEDHEYFWKYLYHSSPTVLDSQAECLLRYNRYRPAIHQALSEGSEYPWTELAGLQLPKLYSDMIESILGAVYLDSGGDIEACTEMLRRIGLLRILERVENGELQIRHPITVVQEWAALNQSVTYGYLLDERAGMVRCRFVVDQEVIATEELAGNGPAVLRALRMRCAASGMQALGL
jgi:endoribonuclease Dicer